MGLRNPMYDSLLLQKPSREGVAAALFGRRPVNVGLPQRQANAEAIFGAAADTAAAIEGRVRYDDYPRWVLGGSGGGISGLGDLGHMGELPAATTYIPINHPGPPIDVGDAVFGISRGWGKIDGLAPGNLRVPNFESRYKKAQRISAMAEGFKVGTPIRNMGQQFDDRMGDALRRVLRHYMWDQACGFGNDPESPVWDNCRSKGQVDALKTALADTNNALKNYDQLELAIAKAPENWREDYIAPIDYGSDTPSNYTGSTDGQSAYDIAFGSGRQPQAQSQGRSTASGVPTWAPILGGVALLGVLAGGLYFLKKK